MVDSGPVPITSPAPASFQLSSGLDATGPDLGLFGPGSQTWRLHTEAVVGVAALRAILLQDLHPQVVQAHIAHAGPASDVWTRLRRATELVAVTSFGTNAQALAAAARVRAMCGSVHVEDGADPEVAQWMHCTVVDSVLDVMRRAGVPVEDADADEYVSEQVRAGVLIGLEPDELPHDTGQLADAIRRIRRRLTVTPTARQHAAVVVDPEPTGDHSPWSSVSGLAYAALPSWARRMYALSDLDGAATLHGSATTVALHALRASLSGDRSALRLQPGPHLRSARERLAAPPER